MLTLKVTSRKGRPVGDHEAKTFDSRGGSIGRASTSDWVLSDEDRFISGCHAEIACRGGDFYLIDQSTNGTFINGSERPVGKGREQLLSDGDRVQIGDYEIAVSIGAAGSTVDDRADPAMAAIPGASAGLAGFGDPPRQNGVLSRPTVDPLDLYPAAAPQASSAPGLPAQGDHSNVLGDSIDLPPIAPRAAEPQRPAPADRPEEARGGAIPSDWWKKKKAGVRSRDQAETSREDEDPFRANMHARPERQAEFTPSPAYAQEARPVQASTSSPAPHGESVRVPESPPQESASPRQTSPLSGETGSELRILLESAGIDSVTAQAAATPATAAMIGSLLNVVVNGMIEVLRARAEIKGQFRVPVTTIRSVENNPLKFSATPAQALKSLIGGRDEGYLGPVDAFSEGFDDIKAHQIAMLAGMRAAYEAVISRFDPKQLAEQFDRRIKRGALLGISGKGRYWEMYCELYEESVQGSDDNFQRLFGDEFARAYEEQMRRLAEARR